MVDAADGGMAVHTRWSISRGRSLNPQLHPRMLALKPVQRIPRRTLRGSSFPSSRRRDVS